MYSIYAAKTCGLSVAEGITDRKPCFSWRLKADSACEQKSYRIRVSRLDGDCLWDSGIVGSSCTHNISYEGAKLQSDTDYTWQVESISSDDITATGGGRFSTGILDDSLWQGQWIEADYERKPITDCIEGFKSFTGQMPRHDDPRVILDPAIYFRKSVEISKKIRRAIMYVTAHGVYEAYVNAHAFGMPLAPGYTVYDKHLTVQRYDITGCLNLGANVLSAIVADGWYTGRIGMMGVGNQYGDKTALFMQIFVEFEDGSRSVIATDKNFRWSVGGYEFADIFVGERFDARLEPVGFKLPDFDDSAWKPVLVRDYGTARLTGAAIEPAAIIDSFSPVEIITTPKGETVVDAGAVLAGFVEFTLSGNRGDAVSLEYSEVLDHEGNFLQNIMGQNKNQKDYYVFANDGIANYRPKFTCHGFRYVKIEGARNPKLLDFTVHFIGTKLEKTGDFTCSNELLTKLQENIFRSQQGNMLYIPTDCPQRERQGWTGDMQVYLPTACFNMDMESFLRSWLYGMRLEQRDDGQIPNVIPHIPSNGYISFTGDDETSSAAWGDACVIIPWQLYRAYGDKAILAENYEMMSSWLSYVRKSAAEGRPEGYDDMSYEQKVRQSYLWNTGFHFGDWLIPSLTKSGEPPTMGAFKTKELVATAMFAYSAELLSCAASELGKEEDAAKYRNLNEKIRRAFAEEYVLENGRLTSEFQGTYVLALRMGLVPVNKREAALNRLVELIEENGDCLDTGFVSTPFLLDVLYEGGRADVAWKILFQTKCPSWLYEVKNGATTIWESWYGISEDGKRGHMSYNHFSFGCVGDFIYRRILGLTAAAPGYKKVRISPDYSCGLTHAKGSFETVFGQIKIQWKLENGMPILEYELPPGVKLSE